MPTEPVTLGEVLGSQELSPQQRSRMESLRADREKRQKEKLEHWEKFFRSPGLGYLAGMGVPTRYLRARLSDFATLTERGPNPDGAFITGPVGTGKTHLATAWMVKGLRAAAPLGEDGTPTEISAKWVSAPNILGRLRGTFGKSGGETEEDILRDYGRVKLLVLDDLGAEQATDWTGQALYRLISNRMNDCLTTIVTSNLTLEELNQRDPRLASRLGGLPYIRLTGKDRRLGNA